MEDLLCDIMKHKADRDRIKKNYEQSCRKQQIQRQDNKDIAFITRAKRFL